MPRDRPKAPRRECGDIAQKIHDAGGCRDDAIDQAATAPRGQEARHDKTDRATHGDHEKPSLDAAGPIELF
jgi:hypothetical protein